MKRVVQYWYGVVDQGCGCCHMGFSEYSVWEDGKLVVEDIPCNVIEDELQLREYFAYLEPFDVHPDTVYF